MNFFDLFIFNNVKSDLKTILCQPNKVVFKVKVLHLQRLYPYRKLRWAEVGQTYIRYKAFLYALVLTIDELRKFNCKSKTKQRERLMRCIIYSPHWLRTILYVCCQECFLYTYTGVGLSALYQRCT